MAALDGWIFVLGHVHYVNNVKWFDPGYRKLVQTTADGHSATALGEVTLRVKLNAEDKQGNLLKLVNVLCIPTMPCNGVEYQSIFDHFELKRGILKCFDVLGKQQCFGLHVGGAFKVQQPDDCPSAIININKDDFTAVYLSSHERTNLFGGTALYPFC